MPFVGLVFRESTGLFVNIVYKEEEEVVGRVFLLATYARVGVRIFASSPLTSNSDEQQRERDARLRYVPTDHRPHSVHLAQRLAQMMRISECARRLKEIFVVQKTFHVATTAQ